MQFQYRTFNMLQKWCHSTFEILSPYFWSTITVLQKYFGFTSEVLSLYFGSNITELKYFHHILEVISLYYGINSIVLCNYYYCTSEVLSPHIRSTITIIWIIITVRSKSYYCTFGSTVTLEILSLCQSTLELLWKNYQPLKVPLPYFGAVFTLFLMN